MKQPAHLCSVGAAICDVGGHSGGEQAGVLGHDPDLTTVPLGVNFVQRSPINEHLRASNPADALLSAVCRTRT